MILPSASCHCHHGHHYCHICLHLYHRRQHHHNCYHFKNISVDTVLISQIIHQLKEKKRTQPKEELRWRQSAECGEAAPAIVFWSFVSYSQIMALVKM